jgi:hypothetical protein
MHPYHPLCGKYFPILKSRCVRGVECLVLQGSASGTFSVPLAWTDRARPNLYRDANVSPRLLKLETLLQIVELIDSKDHKSRLTDES